MRVALISRIRKRHSSTSGTVRNRISKIYPLTGGDGMGDNTRYTKQYILNAGRTTDTCHIRDVILTPASPLSAAAAHWYVRGEGFAINYMIRDFSLLSAPPFRYVQSQAWQLFAPAVISCPVSKAEATYEQTGYFRREQLHICTEGQVSVLTEGCR